MILCDIGNTTYHFKDGKKDFRIFLDDDIPKFNKKIYFISVNDKATAKLLKRYPQSINLKDIVTFTTTYKGIGVDRIIACSGVKNGIIIDVGSAITIDIMKNGNHLGGFILPGFRALRKIYPQISKKLKFNFEKNINLDKIPLDTTTAINYSIYSMIIEPILKIEKKYKINIFITGGDGKLLLPYLKKYKVKYNKNLIFKNMKKIIKENRC